MPDARTCGCVDHVDMEPHDQASKVAQLIKAGRDREAAQLGALIETTALVTTRPTGGTMEALTQFGQLAGPLGGVVAGINPEQLDARTPCTEFSVRGVLEHMIGGATAFAAAYRGVPAPVPDLGDVLAGFGPALSDLGAAVSAPGALDATIATPFGDVSGDWFARYIVLDGLVHGWDMATATGQPYDPPDELVAAVDAFARASLSDLRGDGAFSDPVAPPANASPIERLAAFTGRQRS